MGVGVLLGKVGAKIASSSLVKGAAAAVGAIFGIQLFTESGASVSLMDWLLTTTMGWCTLMILGFIALYLLFGRK